MYMPSFKLIAHNMYKKSPENFCWLGALVTPPFKCFCPLEGQKLNQPRLWFITGGYLVKRWFIPAAARARGQSNDLNREILASNLFNCHKEVINTPPVPSISRCIHIVYRWRLKSPISRLFTQSFIQVRIKENIKAPRHWPVCGEFTGTGEFPTQRASNAENVSIWWRHHEMSTTVVRVPFYKHVISSHFKP